MEADQMISGIQFISIIFALLMLYITFLHFKRKELSVWEALLFFLIWAGAILLTVHPQSADFILHTFKIYRLLDLATIGGFMLLVALAFINYLELKEHRRKIEKITRHLALKPKKDK